MAQKQELLTNPQFDLGTFAWGETTEPIEYALLKYKTGTDLTLTTETAANSSLVIGSYDSRNGNLGTYSSTSQEGRRVTPATSGRIFLRGSGSGDALDKIVSAGDASGSFKAASGSANVIGQALQAWAHGDVIVVDFYRTARTQA